jgi:hypothetical protein
MNGFTFSRIVGKYKKCPSCGVSYKGTELQCSLENEIITISCTKCGFSKKVDEHNKEVK